jgi:hypothetical protein
MLFFLTGIPWVPVRVGGDLWAVDIYIHIYILIYIYTHTHIIILFLAEIPWVPVRVGGELRAVDQPHRGHLEENGQRGPP